MYHQRMANLHAYMEEQKLDAILITTPKHVYYLTGFYADPHERFMGLVMPSAGDPVLIVPALDRDAAAGKSVVQKIVTHTDVQNPYQVLKQVLPQGVKQLGLEKEHMTVARFEALHASVGAARYVDVNQPLQEMRVIKSAEEIARMKHAIQLVEEALGEGLKKVRPGVTEMEIVAELEYQMKRLGAEGPSFATMVLAGENAALPHGKPGTRPVREGDLLLFDLGVEANGYVSDITRTFAIGRISGQLEEIYQTVLAANQAAIAAVRPGMAFAQLDKTARDVIEGKGYGDAFTHRLGHGLGMEVHEYPSVHGENRDVLRPGMVFTIEPGIYLPGAGGVRIEDIVLVTEDGVEVLTRFPKELSVIG